MEIHQIRYFLALSRTLNFTRAAEECHITQPALTRAIKALEDELGGELIRREGRTSHLTELGRRMVPMLQRCYDSALGAKELARTVTSAQLSPLRAVISHTVNIESMMGPLSALLRMFPSARFELSKAGASEILGTLKSGDADIAIAGALPDGWERLDDWALWEEGFRAVLPANHPQAGNAYLEPSALQEAPLIAQSDCESRDELLAWLGSQKGGVVSHETTSQADATAIVRHGLAIAILPESASAACDLAAVPVEGLDIRRRVFAYMVAGRPRPPAASAFLSLLRATQAPVAA